MEETTKGAAVEAFAEEVNLEEGDNKKYNETLQLLIQITDQIGKFSSFARAVKMFYPIAGSIEQIPSDVIEQYDDMVAVLSSILSAEGVKVTFEKDKTPALIIETEIGFEEKKTLLREAHANIGDIKKGFKVFSRSSGAVAFIAKTEGDAEIEEILRDIGEVITQEFPEMGFYEDPAVNEMDFVTKKDVLTFTPSKPIM